MTKRSAAKAVAYGVLTLALSALLLPRAGAQTTNVHKIGTKKQLFGDGFWLDDARKVKLVLHRPVLTHERCIVADRPWEGHRVGAYNTILEDGGVLKMYYDAIASDGTRWLCLATSTDGVHWEKPELDAVPFGKYKRTNIVFPPKPGHFEPGSVFIDTRPGVPADERYKLSCMYRMGGAKKSAVYVAGSPDGIHFHFLSDKPVFRSSDTGNVCFYDPRVGRYVAYVRVWDLKRKVGRLEFDDFLNWGKEQTVFSYDEEDNRWLDQDLFRSMDFYTNAVTKLPDADNVYLMFPSAYYHYYRETAKRLGRPFVRAGNDGPLDIQFAFSRDGIHWSRPDRRPFIYLGEAGDWDRGYAYMVTGVVLREREIWLYYATAAYTHGDYDVKEDRYTGTITRAVLRRDGFVSVQAGIEPGEFTTPPIVYEGKRLFVNVRTSAGGHLRVALLDTSGAPVSRFSLGECTPINGNWLAAEVKWKTGDLSKLAGTPVRLRFVLRDADLFSFWFSE
ncbi:MAG: glycoside hydrolase family 32 protein [Calditrichaeota bacterium]|nr:glycoside hydrolase family 32 protein [Calditrichota bacterium]